MKKIFDWFRTNIGALSVDTHEQTTHDSPPHQPRGDGLYLNKQHLNRTIVLLLLTSLFIFIAGYFWGQHTAAEQLLTMVERDSFADQVYYAMSATERGDEESADDEALPAQNVDATNSQAATPNDIHATHPQPIAQQSAETEPVVQASVEQKPSTFYKGILAGFSTEKMANQMVQRLKRRGFDVAIVTRHSRTKQGKSVAWYQAVTAPMADRSQLEGIVAQIKKFEKLHDVSIAAIS